MAIARANTAGLAWVSRGLDRIGCYSLSAEARRVTLAGEANPVQGSNPCPAT